MDMHEFSNGHNYLQLRKPNKHFNGVNLLCSLSFSDLYHTLSFWATETLSEKKQKLTQGMKKDQNDVRFTQLVMKTIAFK